MPEIKKFFLLNREIRKRAARYVMEQAPENYVVTIQERTRNLDQNAAYWRIVEKIAKQKTWLVNGEQRKMKREDWSNLITACFAKETESVQMCPSLDCKSVVMLGVSTSSMTKSRFSELIDYAASVAAQLGVEI